MIKAVDLVSPLRDHCDDYNCIKKSNLPSFITLKINQRKRLLKSDKNKLIPCNSSKIKDLNKDIRTYFSGRRVSSVRKAAYGAKSKLWNAVKLAKNQCPTELPRNLTLNGVSIPASKYANSFATHFSEKIKSNIAKSNLSPNTVYNGTCKLLVGNRHFMKCSDVKECLTDLKNKKCEGYDRIPLCVLRDSSEALIDPLSSLFDKIYNTCQIPEQ